MLVKIEIKVFRHVNIPFTFLKNKIYLKNFDNIAGLRVDKKYKNRSCKEMSLVKQKFCRTYSNVEIV